MEGVQFILHNPQYVTEYSWGWSWMGFLAGVLALVFIAMFILFVKMGDPIYILCAVFAALFTIGSTYIFSTSKGIESYHHSEYVVILHEDVNYKEFFEKYEIVDSDGKFYTIIEKDKIIEGE